MQLHVAPADLDGRGLLDKELRNQAACDELRTNGSPGGAFDSPAELHDEQPVQNNIADSACDFAEHGRLGVAHRADKVVHAGGNCLENRTAEQNAHVAFGNGECLLACPEQLEERRHENLAKREGENRHDNQKRERVVENDTCLDVFLLAETDGKKRVAANAYDYGHRHDEQANREAERDACDTETSNALPYVKTIYNVVEGVHAHADDGGY